MRLNLKSAPLLSGSGLKTKSAVTTGSNIFFGAGLDTFTINDKIESNTLIDWTVGQSLALIYFAFTNPATPEQVLGCNTPPLASGKGWRIVTQGNGMYIGHAGASFIDITNTGVSITSGLHRYVLVWRASDNHLLVSHNGSTFVDRGVLNNGTAPDATSKTNIGSKLGDTTYSPLSSGSVCALAIINSEVSQANAQALTAISTTYSRFSFSGTWLETPVGGNAILDFDAFRDWNGSAATITTLGSSPVTFSVTGTPNRTDYSEIRMPTTSGMYFNSKLYVPESGYTLHNAYAQLKFTGVNSRNIGFEWYNNFAQSATYSGINCIKNGSSFATHQYGTTSGVDDFVISTSLNSNSSITLTEGNEILSGGSTIASVTGTFITHLRKPVNSVLSSPSAPQKRLVLLGDSIFSGFYPTNVFTTSITAKLRSDFPTSGTGGVTCFCWGSNSIYMLTSQGIGDTNQTASWLTSCLDGTTNNYLWIQLGTNDYGLPLMSATNFGTAYSGLLDAIHTFSPNTIIYCQTPFQRISPSTESANAYGNTLNDYRSQIGSAVGLRSSYCILVDGTTIYSNPTIYNSGSNPTGCFFTDGLHNVDNGCTDVKNFIKTTINY